MGERSEAGARVERREAEAERPSSGRREAEAEQPPSGRREAEAEQPSSDRRESRRVPVELLIRDLALGGSFEPKRGNLALGGVFFDDLHAPAGGRVEVRFLLPGGRQAIHALAEVIEAVPTGEVFGVRLRFVEIPLEHEMAIARCLQG